MQDPEESDVVGDEEWDDDEDPWDDPNQDFLYLKYMFEGIPTLSDLATALRALADDLDGHVVAGWELEEPVESGYAHMRLLGSGDVVTK